LNKPTLILCESPDVQDAEKSGFQKFAALLSQSHGQSHVQHLCFDETIASQMQTHHAGPKILLTNNPDAELVWDFIQDHKFAYTIYLSYSSSTEVLMANGEMFFAADTCLNYADMETNIRFVDNLIKNIAAGSKKIDVFEFLQGDVRTTDITEVQNMYQVISKLTDDLKAKGVKQFQQNSFTSSFVELLTNAVFDAPENEHSEKLHYYDRERKLSMALNPAEHVAVKWLINDRYIVGSVSDNFGTLEKRHLYKVLHRCYGSKKKRLDTNHRGGGSVGFFRILNGINCMIVNSVVKENTEAVCVLDRSISRPAFRKSSKTIYYNKG
jgi:hypothetical protein